MKILKLKKVLGIGLIEVLVTTVVVATGLLAVGSLQGTLISESRESKSRTEAKTLAESKIEEVRDAIVKDAGVVGAAAFLPAAGNANDTVAGVTESFTRSWIISDQAGPERKEIEVSVCWSDGCPIATGSQDNQLVVQGEIIFDNVGNSAKNLKDAQTAAGATGSPSTNAESSDEITKIKDVTDGDPDTLVSTTADDDGLFWIRQDSRTKAVGAYACAGMGLASFENGLYTRRIDFDSVSGNEAIELFELQVIDSVEYCIPRIRYNGGVIIPVRGTVHSAVLSRVQGVDTYLDVNLFTFNASETGAYCVFNPTAGVRSAPYVCYVGGNCTAFSGTTDNDDVTKCPVGSYAATKVGAGGWRGKVGLLGVASASNDFKNVCFAEEIVGEPVAGSLATARNYYALRSSINEGINKPYSCHDFLIIAGQSTERQIHDECVAQADAIGGLNLAIKNIERTIDSGGNVFDPSIDTSYCTIEAGTEYVITGTIENANSIPTVSVNDSVSRTACTVTTTTTTTYNCTITTSASDVTIVGEYADEIISCPVSPVSSTGCTITFTATNDPTYSITGDISGTANAANATTITISNGGSCQNNNDHNGTVSTYTCSISTSLTTITLAATISIGGSVTPEIQDLTLPGGASNSVAGGGFSATMSPVYTISGALTGSNVLDGPTFSGISVDLDMGECTVNAENTTYRCTVPAGVNHLHVSISLECSSSPSKWYRISDGSTSAVGGALVVDLGTVSGSIIKNLSIIRSTTNC